MCGIAGIFRYRRDEQVDEQELLRIRDAMVARGPDGAGLWLSADKHIGLAHRRLAIIDLSEAGAQPMASADGRFVVTFNGEIYNYRELRRELEGRGHRFRSQSDTEVLLFLYREYGAEMVHRLRGMYAFALWDEANRSLFLARDPFGIKPLYYADDGNTLRFASQVKALLTAEAVDHAPEPAGHVGFFLWGYVPEPYTTHKQIRAVPAGTTLRIDRSGVHAPTPFFSISEEFASARAVAREMPVGERAERLRAELLDSVRHHLVADVPVGLFLSSGMDSSTLAGLASELAPDAPRAVTLGFEEYRGKANDETALASLVARHYGMSHEVRWYTRREFDSDLQGFLAAMDQPTTDGLNTYLVAKATAESGIKVALSGLGGDELFGGYPSFRDVPRSAKLLAFSRSVPRLGRAFRRITAPLFRHSISPKWAGLFEYGGSLSGAYLLRRGLYMPWELPQFLDPEMVRAGWHELQPLVCLDRTIEGLAGSRAVVSALELTWYLRSQLLKDTDWAGMAHSLEIRVPFVDVELFRALASLMVSVDPLAKRELGGVPRRSLPAAILGRRKTGFAVPVREWHEHAATGEGSGRGLRSWARFVIGAWETTRGVPPDLNANREACVSEPGASSAAVRRVLIYRLGSLGDTVVALPCFHLIARVFPAAERRVLTNIPVATKASSLSAILGGSGLADGYMAYPIGLRGIRPLLDLRKKIRAWGPDVLVYLTAPRGRLKAVRDALFFRFCGIRTMFGVPYTDELQKNAYIEDQNLFEHEAARLARCLEPLGDAKLYDSASWDLHLSSGETQVARGYLDRWPGKDRLIACSVGTKFSTNDWGQENWRKFIDRLGEQYGSFGLLLVGSAEEFERSEQLSRAWPGPTLNLCGKLTPRESAVVLGYARAFVGHDSGPMHLAASVGTACVAIFSARNRPGVWFPHGQGHKAIYHRTPCYGCGLTVCERFKKMCILSITVDEVLSAVNQVMSVQRSLSHDIAL